MADIRIDLDAVRDAGEKVATVLSRLDGAGDETRTLPDAAGHSTVSGALGDFRDKWSIRKGELVEELTFVSNALTAISDTFRELDGELVNRLDHFVSLDTTP